MGVELQVPGVTAETKKPVLKMYKSMRPVFEEMPTVLEKLVEPFTKVFHAVVNGGKVSDKEKLFLVNKIFTDAGPIFKKLGKTVKDIAPIMEGISNFDVDK